MDDNNLVKLLEKYETFTNIDNDGKTLIYNFFDNIKKDLDICNYNLEKIIEKFLNKSSKYVSYGCVFDDMYWYRYFELPNDLNKLESLLNKYNKVKLNLPFDVSTSTYSFSKQIYNKILEKQSSIGKQSYNGLLKMLEIIVRYLPKSTEKLITNSNTRYLPGLLLCDKIFDDNFDIDNMEVERFGKSKEKMFSVKCFKLLIENNMYEENNFDGLLSFLYCRQDMVRLKIIKKIKPDMLSINLKQLIKIIFYGRHLVLQFVIDNLFDQFKQIVEQYNPYDIRLLIDETDEINKQEICIESISDIWNGWFWYNDEHDKPCIGQKNFDKVFELMNNNSSCVFNNELVKSWLEKVLTVEDIDICYFITKNKLVSILCLDTKTKKGIEEMVDIIGYEDTWKLVKNEGSDVFKLLLDK